MNDIAVKIDVTGADFEEKVLAESARRPVLVDFWADWCAPCRMLMPILEKLAYEYKGNFLLAKVNSDQNQDLSAQYGVRSLPTVKLFVNGEVVNEFMGALPESDIRNFLEAWIPRESDQERQKAIELFNAGQLDEALAVLTSAMETDPQNIRISYDIANIQLAQGNIDEAENIYRALDGPHRESEAGQKLHSRIHIARETQNMLSREDAGQILKQNEKDPEALYSMGMHEMLAGHYQAALDYFLALMKSDRTHREGAAHKMILDIFTLLGDDSELTGQYRRKLAMLMY